MNIPAASPGEELWSPGSLTGAEVEMAFAALGLEDNEVIARWFDVTPKTVWYWRRHGCSPHIALALEQLLNGRVTLRGLKWLLRRMGVSRRDRKYYSGSGSSEADSASA